MSFSARFFSLHFIFLLSFVLALTFSEASFAQSAPQAGLMTNGDAAVTGFSGTTAQNDVKVINPDGVNLKVFDLSSKGKKRGQIVDAPNKFKAMARDIGQVFGVTLDSATPPNIYVTATSAFGLSIVDATGNPLKIGAPGATFMPGQFGSKGGPGSVWKIDGVTGDISLFANLQSNGIENGGAGLGNIVYDATHFQFYVSDLASGLIHRLDLSGNVIDTFDHGATGRPAGGLDSVPMDSTNVTDISSSNFDVENSDTWGQTDIRRRVWGMAYFKNRLYYSPSDGPQIWSIGVNTDGTFLNDARVEIEKIAGGFPVADMLFTSSGQLIASQRGGLLGSSDYSNFHTGKFSSVLRYSKDANGAWNQKPDQYAIGMPVDHKNASGGVGLACGNALWSTGDALGTASAIIHGLQGNLVSVVRPLNTPPSHTWLVDFDGLLEGPEQTGHVGDVAIYRDCRPPEKAAGFDGEFGYPGNLYGNYEESWPGWTPNWTPPPSWTPPPWWKPEPDFRLSKSNAKCTESKDKGLYIYCRFVLTITNVSGVPFTGQLRLTDNVNMQGKLFPPIVGSVPWTCAQSGGAGASIFCRTDNALTLAPGQSQSVSIGIRYNYSYSLSDLPKNCAKVTLNDNNPNNDRDCGIGYPPPFDYPPVPDAGESFCPKGWVKRWQYWVPPTGWELQMFYLSSNTEMVWCARKKPTLKPKPKPKPPVQSCPKGWTRYPVGSTIPDGWVKQYFGKLRCAQPGPVCNDIESSYGAQEAVPTGWISREVTLNGHTIWCAVPPRDPPPQRTPPPNICGPNATFYNTQAEVPSNATNVWSITVLGARRWCATFGPVTSTLAYCNDNEKKYSKSNDVPSGWVKRLVMRNGQAAYCARPSNANTPTPPRVPALTPPRPTPPPAILGPRCSHGERTVRSSRQVPRGWKWRRVTRNGRSIICARSPGAGPALRCGVGTHISRGRCVPNTRPAIRCRSGQHLSRGRCVPNTRPAIRCRSGQHLSRGRCVPNIRPAIRCRSGQRLSRGRCVPNTRPAIRCRSGQRLSRGRCVPNTRPALRCRGGQHLSRGRCVPNARSPRSQGRPQGRSQGRTQGRVLRCPSGTRPFAGNCVRG